MATKPWQEEADDVLLRQPGQTSRDTGAAVLSVASRIPPPAPPGLPP